MFGYVRAFKPDLRMREYDAYKGVYCTLCRELGKGYGLFARFTLSYDFVFLAMLRLSAGGAQDISFVRRRCPFNPLVKCRNVCTSDGSVPYSAGVAMLLLYEKLRDNLHDEGFFGRIPSYLLYPMAASAAKKARRNYPELAEKISGYMARQQSAEAAGNGLDACADPSAQVLSTVMSYGVADENKRRILERIGYCVGKWVYLTDAFDDLADDLKKKRFNPFGRKFGLDAACPVDYDSVFEQISSQLNVCICEACSAFELLELTDFRTILENILYQGLPSVQNEILAKHRNQKGETAA